MDDNYEFQLVGGPNRSFEGYVSAGDRTMISPRLMVKGSKNVYIKESGTISVRPGLKRRGSADSTAAGVLAAYDWATSLGTTRNVRVANSKLEVESDIVESGTYVWYTLLDSLTNTRLIFDTWWDNTAKKDILVFCDGTSDIKNWSGAIGLLDAGTTTATVIGLTASAATLGFQSGGGTVIINGTEYTYTGTSGSTLTGAQDATSEADGSVVLDKPETNSNVPSSDFTVDFLKTVNNQVYYGSETSRLVYISTNSDFTDVSANSPRTVGDADILTLDENPTGIGVREGTAHISTRSAWYVVSFNQITVGSTLTEQTIVDKIPMADEKGALRHEFITNVGNDLVYLSQDQQLHVFGSFRNINQPQFPSLSNQIEQELSDEDFTNGHIRAGGDFIYLTAPNNGRVWLHETRTQVNPLGNIVKKQFWHAPFIWNISRIAIIDGVEYGHSNANPQLYQLWATLQWHDDAPSGDELPYDCVAAFAYRGTRNGSLMVMSKAYYEGYMTPGTNLNTSVVFEYKGERSVLIAPIRSDEIAPEFYTGNVGLSLGDAILGDNPLGDSVSEEEAEQELLPKFRAIRAFTKLNVFEYQQRVYSTEADSRWELLLVGTNAKGVTDAPTFLVA